MAFDSQKCVAWMKELIEKNEDYNIDAVNYILQNYHQQNGQTNLQIVEIM